MKNDSNSGSEALSGGQIRRMAGHIYGTNVGKVFLEFEHTDRKDKIAGVLR